MAKYIIKVCENPNNDANENILFCNSCWNGVMGKMHKQAIALIKLDGKKEEVKRPRVVYVWIKNIKSTGH